MIIESGLVPAQQLESLSLSTAARITVTIAITIAITVAVTGRTIAIAGRLARTRVTVA